MMVAIEVAILHTGGGDDEAPVSPRPGFHRGDDSPREGLAEWTCERDQRAVYEKHAATCISLC